MKLLLFLFLPFTILAGKTYTLDVKVTSKLNDQPMSGVEMILYHEGEEIARAHSDEGGKAQFSRLKEKEYDLILTFNSSAYEQYNAYIFNKSKKDCSREISLMPTQEAFVDYCEKLVDVFLAKNRHTYPADTSEKCEDLELIQEAEFPGGQKNMFLFISNYLEYPEESIEMGEQGRVYLSFIVEPDGTITEVKIDRGVSLLIDREAKRIIRAMPRWIPAICNGKRIRTRMRIPLNFALS
ncbi:MAG: TonB family protein [Bacteroidetes bacterium]|nr:MAG: TonB family protein [Bacteroidota bacterium]